MPAPRAAARTSANSTAVPTAVGGGAPFGSSSGGAHPPSVDRLIHEFAQLPGIGRRSAERLAFHILKAQRDEALGLAQAIQEVKDNVRHCTMCYSFTEDECCPLCRDARRDRSIILVVEQPKDLLALEGTGMYRGVYHVLMGRLSPLESIGPEHLTIADLFARVDDPAGRNAGTPVREVILGLSPNLEGDGTALYLGEQLRARGVKISRLARGLPSGGTIEFANKAVLADAIEGRQSLG